MDSDQLLVNGCVAGDRTSQFRLYQKYAPKMMGICLRYAKNKLDAEEILQEGFLRTFKYIHQFIASGSLEGWIRKIIVNCSLSRFKQDINLPDTEFLEETKIQVIADVDIEENLKRKFLIHLIQQLPPSCRMVFNLFVFEGYKHREIAQILQISEGTSKSNLFDAKTILKKSLAVRELKFEGLEL